MLVGKYYNSGYEQSLITKSVPDTMILNNDGTYTSGLWGNGTYEIYHTFLETRIRLHYNDAGSSAGFESNIERFHLSEPRIMIFHDLVHCYRKYE